MDDAGGTGPDVCDPRWAALLAALGDGYFALDSAGSVVEVNAAFEALLGYGPEGLPYRSPHPWWPARKDHPREHAQVAEAVRAVTASGGAGRWEFPVFHRQGRLVWVEASCQPVHAEADGHAHHRIVGVLRDVTAARRVAQRERLITEIGQVLSEPGPLEQRLGEVTRIAAAVFEELVVITQTGPDGCEVPVAAAHPHDGRLAGRVTDAARLTVGAEAEASLRAGRAVWLEPGAEVSLACFGEQDRHALPPGVSMWAPLAVSGRVLGLVGVLAGGDARPVERAELGLVEELAHRIAGVAEADRLASREHQLHQGAAALATASTVSEAAAALAQALGEAIAASGVAIYTVRPGEDTLFDLVHRQGLSDQFAERFATARPGAGFVVDVAVEQGTPVWLGDLSGDAERFPSGEPLSGGGRVHAVAAVPLRVGEQVRGVALAAFTTRRQFPDEERAFIATLVAQAAQVVERAALTDARWQIATTLQHALLPRQLPTLARLGLAGHYEPAGEHTAAGGDWYDVLTLPDGRVALVVGDVVGSGPAAAAVMAQLRAALAGFLLEGHGCAKAVTLLSRLAARIDGARTSTVACMILDTDSERVWWAHAGHPPPLLLDPQQTSAPVRWLDGPAIGPALGITTRPAARRAKVSPLPEEFTDAATAVYAPCPESPYLEETARLQPGASVLLYTDGLIERRGEHLDDGLARLAEAVRPHGDYYPAALLSAALRGALRGAVPADDVALVVARLRPAPLVAQLPARPEQLRVLRHAVRGWMSAAGLPAELGDDVQLALGEAAANAVEHAYPADAPGLFDYRVEHTPTGGVRIEVVDHGRWRAPPADPGFRGRGMPIIHELAQDAHITHDQAGTRAVFTLPGAPSTTMPIVFRAAAETTAERPARVERAPATGATLRLSGDFDLSSVEHIQAQLRHQLDTLTGPVTLDTREITYLTSAGLRLLADVVHTAAGRVRLDIHPGTLAHRVLSLTGITELTDEPAPRAKPETAALTG